MIAAWEVVVGSLVPLCSASAYAGYSYAKRIVAIESSAGDEPVGGDPPAEPPPRPPRRARSEADDEVDINLSERLEPFGSTPSEPTP